MGCVASKAKRKEKKEVCKSNNESKVTKGKLYSLYEDL